MGMMLLLFGLMSGTMTAATPKFYGYMMSSGDFFANAGIYSFSADGKKMTVSPEKVPQGLFNYELMFTVRGGYFNAGGFHMINADSKAIESFDIASWSCAKVSLSSAIQATDLAYDPETGRVYGCFMAPGSTMDALICFFGTLDPKIGEVNKIADLEGYFRGLTADNTGRLYAITDAGNFVSVDKTNGATSVVGSIGVEFESDFFRPSPLMFDYVSGNFYWVYKEDSSSHLYRIARDSGRAILEADFPQNEYFMTAVIANDVSSTHSPAMISDLAAYFTDSKGSVSFTIPTVTLSGANLSGSIVYAIDVEGGKTVTGTSAPGEKVNATITTSATGILNVKVTLRSGENYSVTTVAALEGSDTPEAPVNVEVAKGSTSGEAIVSWTAPTRGVNDTNLDVASLKYNVKRQPEGVVVAQNVTATSYTDRLALDTPMSVYYEVSAVNNNVTGAAASSPKIVLGPGLNLPWRENFESEEKFDLFTIIDCACDGKTWMYYRNNSGGANAAINFSETQPKDDWLVTPPMAMKPGYIYTLSFKTTTSHLTYPEYIEVKLATAAAATAFTVEIMPNTKLNGLATDGQTHEYLFSVDAEGDYYVGFHATSAANQGWINVDDILLQEVSVNAPAIVTDVVATPAPGGDKHAQITFTLPTATASGAQLKSLTSAEVYLNGTLASTIKNPSPGETVTVDVKNTLDGLNNIEIYCSNDAGRSVVATAIVYTGLDTPGLVKNPAAVRNEDGSITISWECPDGANGGYIDPETTQYLIMRYINEDYDDYTLLSPATGVTTYTDDYSDDYQVVITYMIFAINDAGNGKGATVPSIIAGGTPYELPFEETFRSGFTTHVCSVASVNGGLGSWTLYNKKYDKVAPYDNDNGSIAFYANEVGDCGRVFFGNITLAGAANPTMEFYYYNDPESSSVIYAEVMDNKGIWKRLSTIEMTGDVAEWRHASVSLDAFRNSHIINISIVVDARDMNPVYVDLIEVRDIVDYDLMATLDCRRRFDLDSDNKLNATIKNLGTKTVDTFRVDYYCDGELVATVPANEAIASGETRVVTGIVSPDLSAAPTGDYQAVAVFDNEMRPVDNKSNVVTVTHVLPKLPVPVLAAEINDGKVDLSWTEPDIAGAKNPVAVTDDFESYEPFLIDDVGEWTLLDINGEEGTFGLFGFHFPHREEAKSFQVFGLAAMGITMADDENTWRPTSGDLMMISFADKGENNDDWMISPELSGDAQTISFWGKSATYLYPFEIYAVMASSTGKNPEDFELIESDLLDSEWTNVRVDLPVGTKYFAIRNIRGSFAMCVDDVTFVPAATLKNDDSLKGYNIYRDNVKLNNEPLRDVAYSDIVTDDSNHVYTVTALYSCGESARSNRVTASSQSWLGNLRADAASKVRVVGNTIVITCADGCDVRIHSVDGVCHKSFTASGSTMVDMADGIWIVTVGSTATKVVIK